MNHFLIMLLLVVVVLPVQAETSEISTVVVDTVVDGPAVADSDAPELKTGFRLKDEVERDGVKGNGASMGEMVLGLLAVLAIILGLAWISKRFNLNMPGATGNMRLLSAMSVGQKERIMLVEVEGEKILLGVTPGQINLLKEYPLNCDESAKPPTMAGKGEFASRMQALLRSGASQHE